jgi:hypothetical protein
LLISLFVSQLLQCRNQIFDHEIPLREGEAFEALDSCSSRNQDMQSRPNESHFICLNNQRWRGKLNAVHVLNETTSIGWPSRPDQCISWITPRRQVRSSCLARSRSISLDLARSRDADVRNPSLSVTIPPRKLLGDRKVLQVQLHFEMQMLCISRIYAFTFFPCVNS